MFIERRLTALPSVLLFHPSLPHLVVCDRANVSSYNLENTDLINRWPNHPGKSHRITSACVINGFSGNYPLLAVAADDGSVRLWNNPFTCTRLYIRDYALKDPYFKSSWLEAKSSTCTSKTSKTTRDFTNWETMSNGWKNKGSNLFIGSTFVGDCLGGFLGEGCRNDQNDEKLMGGYFTKGYGWQAPNNSLSCVGSPAAASTPSPSSSGWTSGTWGHGGGIPSATPAPVNGWAVGANSSMDNRILEQTKIHPKMVTAFTATTNVRPGMKGPGPLVSWCQSTGRLAVAGGEQRSIRLWDLRTELHAGDLLHSTASATSYSVCITALHSRGLFLRE